MERNEKLESIVRLTQKELKQQVKLELEEMGYKPISKKGFLYAEGEHPVLLVAHLDTVHKTPVQSICYSTDGRVMMSPEGIGGDDRCGVYMILEIIKSARCHVLFCEDEEIGCQGARAFANSKIRPQVNYIVEMDRRGSNDAVFYRCANPDFTDFVCGFGFDHALGSFSDICAVAPRLGVAAVNISAGYHNEHSRHEQIDLPAMQNNIRRITEMVQTPSEPFDYVEQTYFYGSQMTMENISLWDIVWMTDFKTLLLRAKENDQAAFEEILAMYRPLLLKESIINGRMDMDEDLFQELSLTLFRCIQTIKI